MGHSNDSNSFEHHRTQPITAAAAAAPHSLAVHQLQVVANGPQQQLEHLLASHRQINKQQRDACALTCCPPAAGSAQWGPAASGGSAAPSQWPSPGPPSPSRQTWPGSWPAPEPAAGGSPSGGWPASSGANGKGVGGWERRGLGEGGVGWGARGQCALCRAEWERPNMGRQLPLELCVPCFLTSFHNTGWPAEHRLPSTLPAVHILTFTYSLPALPVCCLHAPTHLHSSPPHPCLLRSPTHTCAAFSCTSAAAFVSSSWAALISASAARLRSNASRTCRGGHR